MALRALPESALTIALCVGLALSAGAQGAAPIEEARRLLGEANERDVRRGAELCVEIDDVDAVEALLEVLNLTSGRGLAPAHYRDVAWESLTAIRDPYARARVEVELRKNKKNGLVRAWCAELLGIYGSKDYGPSLRKALGDKELEVRRAAARALGRVGDPESTRELGKLVKHKDRIVRANAIEALATIDPDAFGQGLIESLSADADGGVRCALLGAVPALFTERTEELSTPALEDEDWRPRMQAVENLGEVRTKSAVDTLIGALADARPVVAARANEALQALTGQKHSKAEAWSAWWDANRAEFAFPEGLVKVVEDDDRSIATYNGIRLVSDHAAFLIDKSRAMSETLKSESVSKEEAAQRELARVLTQLEGELTFNVFTYNVDVQAFQKKPASLKKSTRKKALAFVEEEGLRGAKDIWMALETVLADPTLDTAYLLSSGEPDIGTYVHWNRVAAHLADLNRFHKVRVHAIAYSDSEYYREQLEKIASATGGEFKWFE